MIGILASLVPLAVVIAVVVAIARRATRPDDRARSVLDVFVHLVAAGLALVAASGLSQLAALALAGPGLVRVDEALAVPVTWTVVGLPLYVSALAWLLRDGSGSDGGRTDRDAWLVHQGVVELVALGVVMVTAFDLSIALLAGGGGWAEPTATLVVWGGLWWLYRWLRPRHDDGGPEILPVLVGSTIGLATLATGVGRVLTTVFEELAFSAAVVVRTGLAEDLVVLAIGAAAWTVYWIRDGQRRGRDAWWTAWVLLGPILVGVVTFVGAAGFVVWTSAVWLVGDPTGTATAHFAGAPAAGATAIVAAATWLGHRRLLHGGGTRRRTEVDRIHDLVLAGIGLVAAAGGLATILVALVEAAVGPATVEVGTSAMNTLLGALTFLAIGVPLWWGPWGRSQRLARRPVPHAPPQGRDGEQPAATAPAGTPGAEVGEVDPGRAERRSPSRRIYLYGLFGLGGLVAVVTLLAGVVSILEDVLGGTTPAQTLSDARYAVATIVVVGVVATYHWTVWRHDRDLGDPHPLPDVVPGTARPSPARVTLVGVADQRIVADLRAATGAVVELWERTDQVCRPWDAHWLAAELAGRDDAHVVVLSGDTTPEVIAVRR